MAGVMVRNGLQDTAIFEALKEVGLNLKVISDTEDSCIDIWLGSGTVIQLIDIVNEDIGVNGKLMMRKTRIQELAKDFPKAVVITLQQVKGISKCFYLLQKLIVIDNELTLVTVEDEKQAAKYIKNLLDCSSDNSSSATVSSSSPHPLILQTVQCLPKTGKVKSVNLLENFKSIYGIASASKEELAVVVTATNAQAIYSFLHESQ